LPTPEKTCVSAPQTTLFLTTRHFISASGAHTHTYRITHTHGHSARASSIAKRAKKHCISSGGRQRKINKVKRNCEHNIFLFFPSSPTTNKSQFLLKDRTRINLWNKMKFKYSFTQLNDFVVNKIKLVVPNFINKQAHLNVSKLSMQI